MDIKKVKRDLKGFISQYRANFVNLSKRESQLLEIGALVLAAEHYRRQGFTVHLENLQKRRFRVKLGARGKPFNFSWYAISRDDQRFEIHSNLCVAGAWNDGGLYVIDVGVVNAGKLPADADTPARREWKAMENKELITFVEAKKLVIYPMLMAQFYGIVHEIKPEFVDCSNANAPPEVHFYPSLVSVGYLYRISGLILEGFRKRGFRVNVIPTFDEKISQVLSDPKTQSPFLPQLVEAVAPISASARVQETQPYREDSTSNNSPAPTIPPNKA